jgi:hypothetical protein
MWAKPFLHDEGSTFVKDRSRFHEKAAGVEHGPGNDQDISGGEVVEDVCIEGVEEGLSVREDRPLWNPRGSRGIHENMGVFIPNKNAKLGFMDRVFEKGFFIVFRPIWRIRANGEVIPVGDIQTGSNRGDYLFKFCIEDEHPGATVFNNKFEFRSGESPVKGDEDGTDFRKGEEDFEVWMAIVKEDGNPIPLLDSSPQKKMAELIGA